MVETEDLRQLRDSIRAALGSWRRFVIAIDGVDGAGKSTLSRYLAWQLGIPAIETDLFLDQTAGGLNYRLDEIERVVKARLARNRPVMLEGVLVLHLLERLDLKCDFLVWVEQDEHEGSHALSEEVTEYTTAFRPRERANSVFRWRPVDLDEES